MSEPTSISSGIAERYASAVFELAKENGTLDALERDVDALSSVLNESSDFRDLIHSPIYSRDQQEKGVAAVGSAMDLSQTTTNTLRLMATKRRLFVLPQLTGALRERIAAEKGEVTAEVRAAAPLSDEQRTRLAETLTSKVGKDVKMNVSVDESLIGGLVVKVGSRMIDTSIRSRLDALHNTMKEVG